MNIELHVLEAQRLTVTPDDCILILLPSEAFDPDPTNGDRSMAQEIALTASTVLGTRRVLVLDNRAQIAIAPLPADD